MSKGRVNLSISHKVFRKSTMPFVSRHFQWVSIQSYMSPESFVYLLYMSCRMSELSALLAFRATEQKANVILSS